MFRALLMQKAKSQGINDPSFRISIDSGRSPTLSYTFKNPVTGQYSGIENVVIEWGDGTSTQLISEDDKNVTVEKLTHTYVEGKVWQIKMTSSDGKIPQFNFNTDTLLVSVDSSLCSMTAKNGSPVTDFTNFFANCTNLGNVCGNLFSQNPNITSFNQMLLQLHQSDEPAFDRVCRMHEKHQYVPVLRQLHQSDSIARWSVH